MEKLFDSELKVMEVLWQHGETTAKDIASLLGEEIGWSKTTTYTVIKKCINKGAIERLGKNFLCRPLISKEEVRALEAQELVDKMFDGKKDLLIAQLIGNTNMSEAQLEKLKQLAMEMDQ